MKNSVQKIQLAIYVAILSLTLVWLVITVADTAVLALREWEVLPCVTTHHHISTEHQQPPPFKIEYLDFIDDDDEEEEEDNKKTEVPSPQNVIMPPATGGDTSNLIVSDLLVKTPKINVFASLTRDFHPIASRLNDKSQNTTVLAPLNSAINSLPRKPWEDPEDYERFGQAEAYKGDEGKDRAQRNLQRFVEAHLVPISPWREGEEVETVGGGKVKWVKEGDTVFIEPGHVEVDSTASEVANGNVWVLKGVVNYQ